MLLALKIEEEPRHQGMKWPLEGEKGKGIDFFPRASKRNAALFYRYFETK